MGLDMFLRSRSGEKLGYWRKANAIHGWFCRECFTEGGENGDMNAPMVELVVPRTKALELLSTVREVLEDNSLAAAKLPTVSGFFYGSVEYSDWYWQDLRDTVGILMKALELPGEEPFIYLADS